MKKAARRLKRTAMVHLEPGAVREAIDALDVCEQLLELLRGILNGGDDFYGDDLIQAVQDRVIVVARMQLADALPKKSAATLHIKAGPR